MIPDTGPAQVWGLWQFVLSDYGFMLHKVSWMSRGPGTSRCFDTILHLESFRLRSLSVEFFIRSKQTSGTRPWGKRKMICGTMWNEQYRHAWTCYWNVQHDGGSESPRLYLHTLLSNWSSWIINIQKLKTMSIVFLPNSWHNSRWMIFWTDLVHTRLAQEWAFYCVGVKGSQVIPSDPIAKDMKLPSPLILSTSAAFLRNQRHSKCASAVPGSRGLTNSLWAQCEP